MPASDGTWLEGENPFAEFDKRGEGKAESKQDALVFAQKYLIFESGIAKELLEFWSQQVRMRKVAPSASASELSYFNGVREFVEQIHTQIQFAKSGGQTPYRER